MPHVMQSDNIATTTGKAAVWFEDLKPGFNETSLEHGPLDAPNYIPAGAHYAITHGPAVLVMTRATPR